MQSVGPLVGGLPAEVLLQELLNLLDTIGEDDLADVFILEVRVLEHPLGGPRGLGERDQHVERLKLIAGVSRIGRRRPRTPRSQCESVAEAEALERRREGGVDEVDRTARIVGSSGHAGVDGRGVVRVQARGMLDVKVSRFMRADHKSIARTCSASSTP